MNTKITNTEYLDRVNVALSRIASEPFFNPSKDYGILVDDKIVLRPTRKLKMTDGSKPLNYMAIAYPCKNEYPEDTGIALHVGNQLFLAAMEANCTMFDPAICGLPVSIEVTSNYMIGMISVDCEVD